MPEPGLFVKKKENGLTKDQFRCEFCGNLLAKGKLGQGSYIDIKCKKCNSLNGFEVL